MRRGVQSSSLPLTANPDLAQEQTGIFLALLCQYWLLDLLLVTKELNRNAFFYIKKNCFINVSILEGHYLRNNLSSSLHMNAEK